MKINFMKDEALAYFKANTDINLNNYLLTDSDWVIEKYNEYKNDNVSPYSEFKLDVPNVTLNMKNEQTDVENLKLLYLAFKDITDTQAADERLWVGLAHTTFWEFMKYRCKIGDDDLKSSKVLSNFFFNYGQKRSLFVHPLARLWWVGRLTYNKDSKEQFEGLDYLKGDFSTKVLTLFSSNYSNNPKITQAILKAVLAIEENGNKVGRKEYFEILRYVNFLGGVVIIDYLSSEEIKDKIMKHYYTVNK